MLGAARFSFGPHRLTIPRPLRPRCKRTAPRPLAAIAGSSWAWTQPLPTCRSWLGGPHLYQICSLHGLVGHADCFVMPLTDAVQSSTHVLTDDLPALASSKVGSRSPGRMWRRGTPLAARRWVPQGCLRHQNFDCPNGSVHGECHLDQPCDQKQSLLQQAKVDRIRFLAPVEVSRSAPGAGGIAAVA